MTKMWKETNLPIKMISLIAFSQIGNICMYSAMFGYLPNLLHEFGQKWTDVGFYQGVVLALFMTSFCLSSLVSGKIVDHYGSRALFAICLFFQACTACFIAFTSSTKWLYIGVILIGLSTASELVAKVIVYEISDESNKAYVYNFAISMPTNVSLFLGPALGGILSFPAEQYPDLISSDSLFSSFPILLPNMIISVMLLITSVSAFIMCKTSDKDANISLSHKQYKPVSDDDGDDNNDDISVFQYHTQRNVVLSMFILIIYTLAIDGFTTLLGVWLQTPSTYFGVGYSPKISGSLMLVSGLLLLITDTVFVGTAIDKLGLKRGFMVCFSLYAFLVSIIWMIPGLKNNISIFILITITVVSIRTSVSGVKVALFAYMNSFIPKNISGRVISVRECIKSLTSIAAHPLAGSLFAWSLGNNKTMSHKDAFGFPLNYAFTFYLISFISCVAIFTSVLLDDVTEPVRNQKREDIVENQRKEDVNQNQGKEDIVEKESIQLRQMKKRSIQLETVSWWW